LSPFNYVPGIFAEGLLTVWLLAFGATPPHRNARHSGMIRGAS
jgi:hypothetical protein